MKNFNLVDLTLNELKTEEMEHLRGGGVPCRGNCKSDTNAMVNKTLDVMRVKNEPIRRDSLKIDK